MKISALCTDIDGTLLNHQRELSPRTIAAFLGLRNKIPIILASSRMPSAMRHLQRELDISHQPLICYNGGYVIQYDSQSLRPFVFDSVFIPPKVCLAVLEIVQGPDIHVSLFNEDYWYAPAQDAWTEREAQITKVTPTLIVASHLPIIENWKDAKTGAHKIMCMGPEEKIHELEQRLNAKLSNELHVYRSKSTYLEIAPKSISKASALKLVLKKKFNLSMSEAIAFGDNYNDIELLQAVGLGIAVGNAREEVKAVSNAITSNSKEDGVAEAIEKYCL
jgi:Cof subfamily protein (haloacid dehalogenase superfamily)